WDTTDPTIADTSDFVFKVTATPAINNGKHGGGSYDGYASIMTNPLKVQSPNGGETFMAGAAMSIRWEYSSINNVNIAYSTDNGSTFSSSIASVSATTGYYNWSSIANAPSANWKIRVWDATDPTVSDTSDFVFTVISTPSTQLGKHGGGSYDGYASIMTNP